MVVSNTASETFVRHKIFWIRLDFLRFRIRSMHFDRKGWRIRKNAYENFGLSVQGPLLFENFFQIFLSMHFFFITQWDNCKFAHTKISITSWTVKWKFDIKWSRALTRLLHLHKSAVLCIWKSMIVHCEEYHSIVLIWLLTSIVSDSWMKP